MANFEVHKYNQAFMARIGIHSYNLTDPTNEFFKSFATYYNLCMVFVFFTISSSAFVYLNWPNLEIILEPFLMVMAGLQYGGMFISIGLNMRKVKLLHLTLQSIVHSAKNDIELNIYWNAEERCQKYTKVLACYIIVNQTMFCIAFILSIYNVFIGNLDTSTWALPFSLTVPFDIERISGWYILCFIQFIMGISYSSCISTMTSYFISGCFYIGAICDHFDTLIDSIKESKPTKSAPKTFENIKEKLNSLVEIHVQLYE